MEIGYTPEQEALRSELRGYYEKLLDPATVAELHESHGVGEAPRAHLEADVRRRLGRHRLAEGVRRPGPRADRAVHLLRRVDARRCAGADAHAQLASARRSCATAPRSRRTFFLPKILAGEIHFCIGYTEPDAGTDLASLQDPGRARRRRVRHQRPEDLHDASPTDADYVWLAVRTDPEAKKHKGISIIIVPDGHARASRSCRSNLSASHNINVTFYEDVRVPAGNLVGEENHGLERSSPTSSTTSGSRCARQRHRRARARRRRASWAQETKLADGRRVIDQEWVQLNLARCTPARVPAAHELAGRVGGDAGRRSTSADCSTIKVFGTEFYLEALRLLMEILGPVVVPRSPTRPARCCESRLERVHRGLDHPHLRRRHQRDAARPDRHVRAGLPEG